MKTALIGAGVICEQHLIGLRRVASAQVVGVCDLSPAMAQYSAQQAGGVASYTDYAEMLAHEQPDVVHVLTPPKTHTRIISDCLDAGAHVLCEKPIALERSELTKLWHQARACNLWIVEDQNYRFNRPVVELQKLLDEEKLGTIKEIDVRMALSIRAGGRYADRNLPHPSHQLPAGVIHEFLPHLAYLGMMFVPNVKAIDRVAALWSNHGMKDDVHDPFVYDDLDATVVLGQAHLRIRFSTATWPDSFSIMLRGSEGTAQAELFQPQVDATVKRGGGQHFDPLLNRASSGKRRLLGIPRMFFDKLLQRSPYEGLHRLIELTYEALERGGEMPVTFEDMDEAAGLIEALLAEENRL